MGDRTFVTVGAPVHVGRVDPVVPRSGSGPAPRPAEDLEALADVAAQLQARLDRQAGQLDQLADAGSADPDQVAALRELTGRMRHDTESLLLLTGRDPGVGADAPRPLAAVLADATAAAEDPDRIEVRTAPAAAVVPGAATELRHVVAELLDHAQAAYPGAQIQVSARIAGAGGITVEVRAERVTRHQPDAPAAQRSIRVAERLARHSRHGIQLRREFAGIGVVAGVVAPSEAVLVEQVQRVDVRKPALSAEVHPLAEPAPRLGRGTPLVNGAAPTNGAEPVNGTAPRRPVEPVAAEPSPAPRGELDTASALDTASQPDTSGPNAVATPPTGLSERPELPVRPGPKPRPEPAAGEPVEPGGLPEEPIDELYDPIAEIPVDPTGELVATPIFEEIASAWFRDHEDGTPGPAGSSLDWDTPGDREWRAASERANRVEQAPLTATGLPRRRPGDQLVPPPRNRGGATPPERPAERVPDRIRDRLSGYQRGLQQGRHRAESEPFPKSFQHDPGDPEFW